VIPFFSIRERNAEMETQLKQAFQGCLSSGTLIGGNEVDEFEREFGAYLGGSAPSVIGVGNGLDALRLILLALGIGAGDEVIVPGFTFIATWLAVAQTGAKIVPVDVSLETANLQVAGIEAAISSRTRAIVAVHLYGRIALSPDEIEKFESAGIWVIEDAAQAHGSAISGSKAGTLGTAAAFSFYPTKNLGCLGDGGGVVTRDLELAARIRALSNYGANPADKSHYQILGWNSRLDALQAAFLRCFLPKLDQWNLDRAKIAERYRHELRTSPTILGMIGEHRPVYESIWHQFVIRVKDRDHFLRRARAGGIELACHYPLTPLDTQAFSTFTNIDRSADLQNSRELARTVVSLPTYPQLSSPDQKEILEVVNTID
jgi:dTDP-3-amino-3,4,6-trideoxy-alpha-D-glucose transaminase